MFEFILRLFDTSDFPARWHCGDWSPGHGWLHIGSDFAIFGAYAAIPLSISWFVLKREQEIIFPKLYWLFAAFIFSCGFGHLIEAGIFWQPWYRFSGVVKLITAAVSWATVIALIRVLPQAIHLPGAAELNERLRREIQERKNAEENVRKLNADLKQRVEELETLLEVLPVGIGIALDPECRNIRTNKAFADILKLAPKANASLSAPSDESPNHFRVFSGGRELSPRELPIQAAAAEGRAIHDMEEEIVFDDGTRRILLGSAAPLYNGHQQVRGAVGAFVDITNLRMIEEERKKIEHKLLETQKLESLGVLAGGIAHDFNNLLTGVVGNASLARLLLNETSPTVSHLQQIEDAALRAADLCKQMLAYAGMGRFVVQNVDLSTLVHDTAYLLQSSINKSVVLKYNLADGLPPVLVDATQIRQVVMNLVINASEAIANRSGIVTLTVGRQVADRAYLDGTVMAPHLPEGTYIFLEVSDNGCGMSPETLARIFDPFFTTKFTGRGLGLAAVLGIVRGHHGAMKVYSEIGKGTTFKILLPAAEHATAAQLDHEQAAGADWRGSGTVLVVDDESTVRETSQRMLEAFGFKVTVAQHGREALAIFRENPGAFTAVLLDLTMPQMDGETTFRELRQLQPDLPVILMSGFNEQEAVGRFIGKGLAGFLQKPFTAEGLRSKIRQILS